MNLPFKRAKNESCAINGVATTHPGWFAWHTYIHTYCTPTSHCCARPSQMDVCVKTSVNDESIAVLTQLLSPAVGLYDAKFCKLMRNLSLSFCEWKSEQYRRIIIYCLFNVISSRHLSTLGRNTDGLYYFTRDRSRRKISTKYLIGCRRYRVSLYIARTS